MNYFSHTLYHQLYNFVLSLSAYIQKKKEALSLDQPKVSRCPCSPIFPSTEDLEAIIGDFIECQGNFCCPKKELRQQPHTSFLGFVILIMAFITITFGNIIDILGGWLIENYLNPSSDN